MRNICVRDASCWDQTPNVLNASSTNCNCKRVFTSSAKMQLTLPMSRLEWRVRIQNVALKIHFLVPKCLCKQGTKNVFNTHLI